MHIHHIHPWTSNLLKIKNNCLQNALLCIVTLWHFWNKICEHCYWTLPSRRDAFGDSALVGDQRWAGTYGVSGDFIARDNCRQSEIFIWLASRFWVGLIILISELYSLINWLNNYQDCIAACVSIKFCDDDDDDNMVDTRIRKTLK